MARPYANEMSKLGETFAWAATADLTSRRQNWPEAEMNQASDLRGRPRLAREAAVFLPTQSAHHLIGL